MCDKVLCPTCGSEIKDERAEMRALMGLRLSTMNKAVLRELVDAWPGTVSTERLVWLLYQGSREPDNARGNVTVFVHRLRKLLQGTGWAVVNKSGMGGGRGWKAEYALEKSKPGQ